ncbi:MAG TPA: PQQ-binding-like beta-propeller repeat protein [Gammaproteobacteria bacterium]
MPRSRRGLWIEALAVVTASWSAAAAAQRVSGDAGDWPMYNRDLAGTRHSPLTEITPSNVATLQQAWSFRLGEHPTAGSISGGSELTPVVVDGVMYATTPDAVVAIEAHTGREIWRHSLGERVPSRRGLAYWPGGEGDEPRVFVTSGGMLHALEAATGRPAVGFGEAGAVRMPVSYDGVPTVFESLLIVGSNGPPGSVRAFDARDGAEVWAFRSVPRAGETGNDTWENDAWRDNSGALHWAFSMTVDAERRTLYAVFDAPGPFDYYGGDRPGDNLFGNSIVALDVDTGERKWHFQVVHHDLWDYDLPAPPGLLDVTIEGERVPVLALAAKTGYMYILNRETGRPVFGIEEREVPPSDVPGERASPTQPIPLAPPPIARVSFAPDDIVTAEDTTAEHAAFCRKLAARSGELVNEGPFTPYVYRAAGRPPRSTILFPGSIGGANWGGTASDPSLGYVFVNTQDEASIGWIEASPPGSRLPYRRNSAVGPTSRFQWSEGTPESGNILGAGERAWPCQKPPWGRLVAVNAATGEIAWQVPLGITDTLPPEKQRTGRLNMGGPITTATGLVFIGASNDRRFRAFDSRTGEELWVAKLDMSAHAVPVTYLGRDGKQYVAITASGAAAIDDPSPPNADAIVAFALPR